jgi:SPP1 family predicted phage head-tail adaptor
MSRTGQKQQRVAVQAYTETRTAQGGTTESWATENTMWAWVNPIGAMERIQADQTKAIRTHRISMRFYSPGIDETYRILHGTRIYNIISVVNVGSRGCETILDVKEAGTV